ncbi:MAG: hypothetical protein ACKVP7_04235 [Hyphomicrobiaceae bacterium]
MIYALENELDRERNTRDKINGVSFSRDFHQTPQTSHALSIDEARKEQRNRNLRRAAISAGRHPDFYIKPDDMHQQDSSKLRPPLQVALHHNMGYQLNSWNKMESPAQRMARLACAGGSGSGLVETSKSRGLSLDDEIQIILDEMYDEVASTNDFDNR